MDYYEVTCTVDKPEHKDIIIASLSDAGFEMFEEGDNDVKAYAPENQFNRDYQDILEELVRNGLSIQVSERKIPHQNWNEVWESNFEPVVIAGQVYIKAAFHEEREYPYTIVIQPKMAFGTGHHATTSMMMEMMLRCDFKGKSVMDMGCGTAVLSILAAMLGAKTIKAVDNDAIAAGNAIENCALNNASVVTVVTGDASSIEANAYDILLANINRNIILNDLKSYVNGLKKNGLMLLSGFYRDDFNVIDESATRSGLTLEDKLEKENWMCLSYRKN